MDARTRRDPAGQGARTRPEPSPRLLARLRVRDAGSIAELLAPLARPMVGVAYVVLQERAQAERAAAAAVAAAWNRPSGEWPGDGHGLREELMVAAARFALILHQRAREVDPTPRPGAGSLLRLQPPVRAALALQALAGLSAEDAVRAVRLRGPGARRARNALAGPAERRTDLEQALAGNVAGLPVELSTAAVVRAMSERPPRPVPAWRRGLLPAGMLVGVALVALLALTAPPAEEGSDRFLLGRVSSPATGSAAPLRAPVASVAALAVEPSLADCGIRPFDADLAFDGWTTPAQLDAATPLLASSQPVYAQVPRRHVTWDPRGDADPSVTPLERLACLTDAARRLHVVVRLQEDWQPPGIVDGCPASPVEHWAGLVELGGPRGFLVLPDGQTGWSSGPAEVRLLARLAAAPGPGQSVTAWAQPLGPGAPRQLGVETTPTAGSDPESGANYLWVTDVRFISPGCWVISIAVEGNVIGSAIIPVRERVAAAGEAPRP